MSEPSPDTVDLRSEDQARESVFRLGPGLFRKDLLTLFALGLMVAFILSLLVLYIRTLPQMKPAPNDVQIIRGWLFAVQTVIAMVTLGLVTASYVRFLELTPQFIRQYKLFRTTEIPLAEIDRCILATSNNRGEWTLVLLSKSGARLTGPLPIWRAKDRQKVIAFLLELESRGLRLENLVKFRKAMIANKWGSVPEWDQRFHDALGAELYRCPYELSFFEKLGQIKVRWFDAVPFAFLVAAYLGLNQFNWSPRTSAFCTAAGFIASYLFNWKRPPRPTFEFVVGENGVGFFRDGVLMEAYALADLKSLQFVLPRYGTSPTVLVQMKLQTDEEITIELFPTVEVDREVLKKASEKVKALQIGEATYAGVLK